MVHDEDSSTGAAIRGSFSRRRFIRVTGAAAVGSTVSTAGCLDSVGLGGSETKTLQANSPAAEGSVHGDAAAWIGEIVEEKTDGEIRIEAFRNSELGGQIESIENVSSGDLDMYVIPYALAGTQYPPAQVFDAPYMYDDSRPYEHIYEATDPNQSEAAARVIDELAEETDIRSIGSVVQGTRRVTITGDPVYDPEGLSTKLLRAVPIPIYKQAVVGLGAQTTEIDFSEVPQALATGSIDGQENPYNIIVSSGIHEHSDYVLETDHMHVPLALLLNEDLWQSFTEDQQQIFYDAVSEIQPRATETIESNIESLKDEIRDEGVEIIPPEELAMEEFRTQTREHIREEFPEFIDTIEEIHGGEYR
jgi:TRAP-type C4-dicarboxylate transport system substrate-binding protein